MYKKTCEIQSKRRCSHESQNIPWWNFDVCAMDKCVETTATVHFQATYDRIHSLVRHKCATFRCWCFPSMNMAFKTNARVKDIDGQSWLVIAQRRPMFEVWRLINKCMAQWQQTIGRTVCTTNIPLCKQTWNRQQFYFLKILLCVCVCAR